MDNQQTRRAPAHDHVFLGEGHERNERRTWFVIVLCGIMMMIEIVGGLLYGSIALVADGLHMSTHAGALLLAALAYTYSRKYAHDDRFGFGTGKFGDLAGFTSAIVLVMIALLIGYESVSRFLAPVPIHFGEAIPIAVLGLCVNLASAWLLSGGHDHHHGHGHGHGHENSHDDGEGEDHGEEAQRIDTPSGQISIAIFEDGVPPRFRLSGLASSPVGDLDLQIETIRPDGRRQSFAMAARDGYWESRDEIPEPHAFAAKVMVGAAAYDLTFEEHDHGDHSRDNNMRAAVIHVIADAAVSVLVIVGLFLAKVFGWLWMDPIAGLIGAVVIMSWSYGLVRDTGAILLDMNPDRRLAARVRQTVEAEGDHVDDLHIWRLGPGHLGAIVSIDAASAHDVDYYRKRLQQLPSISHLTVEVRRSASIAPASS
uniref:CDF family Co(II)/Ni(II) efflux transporter DmeF n=1 Tax=Sphingomonas sp. TaxID=28214 RepID=UPI0025F0E5D9|nr:CDF family Co(II)/Ni(II) efflux transporter DmeF [Sphingomonas sp.]